MFKTNRDVIDGFQRLDGDLISLVNQTSDLTGSFQRMDRDLVALANQIADLTGGFQRMDRDLVALANQIADLAGGYQRMEQKLESQALGVIESIELLSVRQAMRETSRLSPVGALPAVGDPAFSAQTPSAVTRVLLTQPDIAAWLSDGPYDTHDQSDARSPVAAAASAVQAFAGARERIGVGARLLWLLGNGDAQVSDDEATQIFGLLGQPNLIKSIALADKSVTVVAGERRREALLTFLRWTPRAIEHAISRSHASSPSPLSRSARAALIPVIDMPNDPDAATATWADSIAGALSWAHGSEASTYGVTWSAGALEHPEKYASAIDKLSAGGGRGRPKAQWMRDPVTVEQSGQVLAIAERFGIELDLTPLSRRSQATGLFAYRDLERYRPMAFDIRIPRPNERGGAAILARLPAITRFDVPKQGGGMTLCGRLHQQAAQIASRLLQVLDRGAVMHYRLMVNDDPQIASGLWEQYHVFNWAPPLHQWVSAIAFEASDLTSPAAPLRAADAAGAFDETPVLRANEFSALMQGRHDAPVGSLAANIDLQVAEHQYLVNRSAPSADSARLATWLPESLGDTLEIGAGFGVLARTFIARTASYVGLDLTMEQAQAVRHLGGAAIIADFHTLPFATGSFDTVVADNVIEHAADPVAALSEIKRVLRERGHAFLVLPLDFLGPDYSNLSHHWKADEVSIRAALKAAGLTAVRCETHSLAALGSPGRSHRARK